MAMNKFSNKVYKALLAFAIKVNKTAHAVAMHVAVAVFNLYISNSWYSANLEDLPGPNFNMFSVWNDRKQRVGTLLTPNLAELRPIRLQHQQC